MVVRSNSGDRPIMKNIEVLYNAMGIIFLLFNKEEHEDNIICEIEHIFNLK